MSVFDYVNSVSYNKKDLMTDSENDELAEKQYVPFVVNRALSYFPDTISQANDMNLLGVIDNKLQYHYLLNSIRPRKRFAKWAKKREDNDLEAVKQYYQYNTKTAMAALTLLTPEQITIIKQKLSKGES